MPSCLIIVENLPVPLDRRVWQEARALKAAGWDVTIICPRTEWHPETEMVLDGIQIYRHSMPIEARGVSGYLLEYGAALFHELRLTLKAWRRHGFDVIHICNPPDLLFLVAAPFRLLGKRVIFDHHDICPELYVSKYGRKDFLHRVLGWVERLTFQSANVVISANETFRSLAISRGGKRPEDVFTVYGIPDTSRFYRISDARDQETDLILGYVGILGKQDGVDHLIRAVADLRDRHALSHFKCRIVGDGPEMPFLRSLASELSVDDIVEFTGFMTGEGLLRAISTFDIGIIPDPYDEYNDKISMNKVFEYATLGIPMVSYRLTETVRLMGDAGTYASENTVEALADAIHQLAVAPSLREERGAAALAHARQRFHWSGEVEKLIAAYDHALGIARETQRAEANLPIGAGRTAISNSRE
jgi:glycosyltransferase involved in cell wall biosynthesis